MKTSKIKIKFPFVEGFRDYHDIRFKQEFLSGVFVDKIKSKEVAYDGCYYGIFYIGKIPSKDIIKEMCIKAGWQSDLDYSDFRA